MRKLRRKKAEKALEPSDKKILGKRLIVICSIIAVIIAAAAGVWFCTAGGMAEPAENTQEKDSDPSKDGESQETGGNAEKSESEDSSGGDNSGSNTAGSKGADESGRAAITAQEGVKGMEFPYSIPGSNLLVRSIASYDGSFIEDGSDSAVSGVTVMVVENTGKTQIEYAAISLDRDGKTLQFEVSALLAGGMAVVQESNKVPFQEGNYTDCTASVAEVDDFTMSEDKIRVEETGEQEITVTNLTDQEIPAVRIFYKFYMEDEDTYVGGITYTAKITNLQAGDSQAIQPSHYLKGSSRIMMVRTYDTAE